MRRNKQQITDKSEITDIIKQAGTARLGINRDGAPYVLPMNFGFADDTFYFHCAGEGLKVELLLADPRVCIEIDESSETRKNNPEKPCSWGVEYRSVIAEGRAEFLSNTEEKKAALNIIVAHLNNGEVPPISVESIVPTTVFKVRAENITAKRSN